MKTKLVFAIIAIAVMVGFGGCAMGTYTISTDSFKRSVFGGSRVLGVKLIDNTKFPFRVDIGMVDHVVVPGDYVAVGYNDSRIFTNQGYDLHIGIAVTPLGEDIGKIKGATMSLDYSQWYWNYTNNNWGNVNDRVILIELSDDGKQIILR